MVLGDSVLRRLASPVRFRGVRHRGALPAGSRVSFGTCVDETDTGSRCASSGGRAMRELCPDATAKYTGAEALAGLARVDIGPFAGEVVGA